MSQAPPATGSPNIVHQQLIHAETIKKETRNHTLYTNFSVNPRALHTGIVADKPNVQRRVQDEAALNEFVDTLRSAKRIPKDKYSYPMTSSQEYGWDIEDEDMKPQGELLYRPKESCELTRFMGEYLKHKAQQKASSEEAAAAAAAK